MMLCVRGVGIGLATSCVCSMPLSAACVTGPHRPCTGEDCRLIPHVVQIVQVGGHSTTTCCDICRGKVGLSGEACYFRPEQHLPFRAETGKVASALIVPSWRRATCFSLADLGRLRSRPLLSACNSPRQLIRGCWCLYAWQN